jgi:hypothetical protein
MTCQDGGVNAENLIEKKCVTLLSLGQSYIPSSTFFTYRIRSLKFSLAFQLSSFATLVTTPDVMRICELLSGRITQYQTCTPV